MMPCRERRMIVREIEVRYGKSVAKVDGRKVTSPEAAAEILRGIVAERPQEVFAAILLNSKHRAIGVVEVSVGTLNASLVHPREVFRAAILENAASIIVGHNHPSGDCSPSKEDTDVTTRLREAGKLMGIQVLDHIIVGIGSADFYSYQQEGRLE